MSLPGVRPVPELVKLYTPLMECLARAARIWSKIFSGEEAYELVQCGHCGKSCIVNATLVTRFASALVIHAKMLCSTMQGVRSIHVLHAKPHAGNAQPPRNVWLSAIAF